MVSEKKPTLKFFLNKEICQLSPLNKYPPPKKKRHIDDQLDVINSCIKFQLNLKGT